jgi:diazepam-binding inhibitor (GABA receptor modulating acyl-CoA-binding protein)
MSAQEALSAQEAFDSAVSYINDPANKFSKEIPMARKLMLYSLYKQATLGDVQGTQPWAVQIEARAKWDAWNSVKGTSKENAQMEYAGEVEAQKTEFQ